MPARSSESTTPLTRIRTLMRIRHGALLVAAAALMVGCSEPTVPDYNKP